MSTGGGSLNITNNYQLAKPLATDNYNVKVFNTNMDKLDKINLPIGSLIWNKNQINPSDYYYGTWQAVEDVFILAASQNYPSGSTGGEANVTLTIDEMPSHSHKYKLAYGGNDPVRGLAYGNTQSGTFSGDYIQNTGKNQAHNNMPPYKSYYCWERIS